MPDSPSMTEATGQDGDMTSFWHAADGTSAKSEAKSLAKRIERRGRTFEIEMPGTADVMAGMNVTLSGFRDGVDGEWIAKVVTHSLSKAGWSTSIRGEGTDGSFISAKKKRLNGEEQPSVSSSDQ